jgi:hypothetical protein
MRARLAFLLLTIGWVLLIGLLSVFFPNVSGRWLFALVAPTTMLSLKISGMEEFAKVNWPKTIAMSGVSAVAAYAMVHLISRFNLPQILKQWVNTGSL